MILFLLLAASAWPQTVALPSLEAPVAAVSVVDAGIPLEGPSSELLAPLALPVESLSPVSGSLQTQLAPPKRSLARTVRSAALATMVSAAASLGLASCSPPAPLTFDAGSPYPSAYLTYPNGHPLAASPPDTETKNTEDQLFYALNAYRADAGVGPLIPEQALGDMARANSIHFPMHGYFSSTNPEGDGPAERAAKVQIAQTRIGEAIAQAPDGGGDPNSVLQAWLADPATKALLTDPYLNGIGTGLFYDLQNGPYWTVDVIEDPALDDGGVGYNPNYDAGPNPLADAGTDDGGSE